MKKIYYIPGLISAVLIPVLFWYYGNQRVHPPYRVMDLGIPAKVRPDTPLENTFEPYRKWNYKKITVKPNTGLQNQKFYVSELKKLRARNEKKSGIEFVINDKNNYQDFIALIDAMILSKQDMYGVDIEKTGHFFALHEYKDPDEETHPICGGTVGNIDYTEKQTLSLIKPESFINHVPQQAFYIIFGFLFFVNISMFSIKENLQIQRKRLA
ncbi:hypothetical protein ACP3T3_21455 [Chryseobacterium sp. CBSDS_008]|uniref:hypothetical protein n=1 Tax=Chryseobacterium sp. CBSDS_008 TaxID=3415265 RepID=UPI003CF5EC10